MAWTKSGLTHRRAHGQTQATVKHVHVICAQKIANYLSLVYVAFDRQGTVYLSDLGQAYTATGNHNKA